MSLSDISFYSVRLLLFTIDSLCCSSTVSLNCLVALMCTPTSSSLSRCREERRAEELHSVRSIIKKERDQRPAFHSPFLPLLVDWKMEVVVLIFISQSQAQWAPRASVCLTSLQFSFLILMDARASPLKQGGVVDLAAMPSVVGVLSS